MAYVKKTWVDRQTEFPARRKLSPTGVTDVYDVSRDEGLVLDEGDAFSASNMNSLETRIATALSEKVDAEEGRGLSTNDYTNAEKAKVDAALPKAGGTMTGTLVAGGLQAETAAQMRNIVVLGVGTEDFSSVPVSTVIFVEEE